MNKGATGTVCSKQQEPEPEYVTDFKNELKKHIPEKSRLVKVIPAMDSYLCKASPENKDRKFYSIDNWKKHADFIYHKYHSFNFQKKHRETKVWKFMAKHGTTDMVDLETNLDFLKMPALKRILWQEPEPIQNKLTNFFGECPPSNLFKKKIEN